MTEGDLKRRLDDVPFAPFRMHLSDGTVIDVTEPGLVIFDETAVTLPARLRRNDHAEVEASRWRTVSIDHIVMFSDLGDSPLSR